MGWGLRLFAAFVGLASFGAGLWPVGVICFAYLATSLRPRKSRDLKEKIGGTHRAGLRHVLAAALLLLSAVALASGGALSPVVFFAGGMTVLLWPKVIRNSPSLELVPVANSVLLRPRFFPLTWVALAEFKAGSEAFPRALSHFTGTLLLFVETGKAYALASCRSLAKREAEINVLSQFKLSAPPGGAYLLPLDSGSAAGVLRVKMAPVRLPPGDLAESAQLASGALVLECRRGSVRRAAACEVEEAETSSLPSRREKELETSPLLWEVLDALGKRIKWPEPDSISDLLDTMVATKGVPLSERVKAIEGSEGGLTVESLSGKEVHLSRPQLRAILCIYP